MTVKLSPSKLKLQQDYINSIQKHNIDVENRIIYVAGDTTQDQFVQFEKNLRFLTDLDDTSTITITIISDGGDWYSGQAFYDAIRECKTEIITVASGSVASAATLIFLAGDIRLAHEHVTFLVHDVTHTSEAKATDVEAELKEVKRQGHIMWDLYAKHTNKSKSYWKKKCVGEYYMSAEEAVNIGFADRIITF